MPGVVACEALYNLIERLIPEATIRYIPAELHEFPINVPVESDIQARVNVAVDDLVQAGCERIVVSYSMDEATRASLHTSHGDLAISKEADCISTVLPPRSSPYGEKKAPRTLYLTRGWIDCGVDSYKLYHAYRDELDELIQSFEEAGNRHDDLRVSWHTGDRFARARERRHGVSSELVDRFFYEIVQHYDRIILVDTGDLHEFHHTYAEEVQGFIERIRRLEGDDQSVILSILDGDVSKLRRLLLGSAEG